MKKRSNPRLASPSAYTAERNSSTFLYVLLTIACAAFLATGFFFAARQHFAAMDLGMKNSTLRKRIAANKGFRQRDAVAVAASMMTSEKPLVERTALVNPSANGPKAVKAFLPTGTKPVAANADVKSSKKNDDLVAINKLR